MSKMRKKMTTDAGRPVGDNQNSLTVGARGPVVFEDLLLFEKMAHFNRERIPERIVHAKGSGAYGYFVCTNPDMPKFTAAKLFSAVGKKTPTFLRFSTVGGEKGSADTERDPRGFALKFYTEEGNWDMVGNNTPVNPNPTIQVLSENRDFSVKKLAAIFFLLVTMVSGCSVLANTERFYRDHPLPMVQYNDD